MAKIVLGLGTSHGPMLSTPPDQWTLRAQFDRTVKHPWKGKMWGFDELVAARAENHFEKQITPELWRSRHAACRTALDKLAKIFDAATPDVVVIMGNDHMEMFDESSVPAFTVFWGEELVNNPWTKEREAKAAIGTLIAVPGHVPPNGARYPCVPALGKHLIEDMIGNGFDVAAMKRLPGDETPHAYGFVYRQIMGDKLIPCVPLACNTYYPPNQPTIRRCYDFGKALARAIESWPGNQRVALIASGGLSHFVIDESIDQTFIEAMKTRRIDELAALGEDTFQSGTSEIKNWVPVAGAMAELGFDFNLVDYVPCYRSIAGTGNAMGFVSWAPRAA
jgi:3-O-methylgallate 3,4-dioxygenase